MEFTSADPSVVRSIRQRDLLRFWIRLYATHGRLPRSGDYRPNRFEEELPDLVQYQVEHDGAEPRYKITHEGKRFRDGFGISGLGQYLHELKDFTFTAATRNLYHESTLRGRPCYSVAEVEDREGRPVSWERLVLPFCDDGDRTTMLMASLKPVSTEGRFESRELMARNQDGRRYLVYAIIDQGLVAPRRGQRPGDDVIG